ncbi:hypothetical protein [Methylobacterium sp.]|uniref:hypothetical protein n=1 Tax=Methylobacterium sp. TaxID=409 RepID=UPI003C749907
MNQQNTGEPKPQALDVLNHLIEMTEARLVDRIDHLHDPVVYEESITDAMRVLVVIEDALGRLIEERDLLSPSEALV